MIKTNNNSIQYRNYNRKSRNRPSSLILTVNKNNGILEGTSNEDHGIPRRYSENSLNTGPNNTDFLSNLSVKNEKLTGDAKIKSLNEQTEKLSGKIKVDKSSQTSLDLVNFSHTYKELSKESFTSNNNVKNGINNIPVRKKSKNTIKNTRNSTANNKRHSDHVSTPSHETHLPQYEEDTTISVNNILDAINDSMINTDSDASDEDYDTLVKNYNSNPYYYVKNHNQCLAENANKANKNNLPSTNYPLTKSKSDNIILNGDNAIGNNDNTRSFKSKDDIHVSPGNISVHENNFSINNSSDIFKNNRNTINTDAHLNNTLENQKDTQNPHVIDNRLSEHEYKHKVSQETKANSQIGTNQSPPKQSKAFLISNNNYIDSDQEKVDEGSKYYCRMLAGDTRTLPRTSPLAPRLSVFRKSKTLTSRKETGPSLTPPSSPLDPPLTPSFPSTSHYISTFRTSGRRPSTSPEKDRDPLSKLLRFLKTFYRELASRDHVTNIPWTPSLPAGTTCPAHFEPALQLAPFTSGTHRPGPVEGEHRDWIRLDQILSTVRTSDGAIHEAPRRVVIEGGPCSGKTTLCLKILHSWATQKEWIGPSIQLALFVPLRELKGCSLAHYLSKELLPKVAGGNNSFLQVWKNLHLLEDRLLFVLDGYDEAVRVNGLESCKTGNLGGGRDALGDAVELLEGRLFPDCRIIITCSTGWSGEMSSFIQRRVLLHGLEMVHVEQLCTIYFGAQKKFDLNKFLDIMRELKPLSCWPLGWLLLCVLYEEEGRIPKDNLELHQDLFKCLIRRSLVDKGLLSISNTSTDLPGHCKKLLAEFGKLALACIKEDRYLYIDSEIKAHCRSSSIDLTELGFLVRGLNFGKSQYQKRRLDYYSPIHKSFAEFLSAYYISSVVHYANILRRELEDLPGLSSGFNSNVDSSTVSILKFLMGLLGRKGHLVFNQLCPLDLSTRPLYMLLQAAGPSEANVTAVSKLVGASNGHWNSSVSKSSPKDQIPLVHTSPLELEGWAWVLKNPACTLEALELVFQFDKNTDCESLLDVFFAALSANDSVKMVRISSLLGHEFSSEEIERLSVYVKTTLPKTKLNIFELVITCLEDSAHDRFQTLVDALCESLEHAASPNLNKLVLDLNLGTSQVVELCQALERAPQITIVHLPHLGCGRDGLRAISELIRQRPLVALNLTGSWGMRREEPQTSCAISVPSSSGISVGSGSGSSNVSSLQQIVKQTSVASSSSPKTSSSGYYFSSLPRGLGGYNSLGRPATLPRQPLTQISPDGYSTTDHKRNSDSVLFQRLFQPLPSCDYALHTGSGFHDVFESLREPGCKLKSLNVSKCLLSMEDSLCLGESIRKSSCLDALRLEGGTRLGEVIPVLLGLAENRSLQLLDLGSQRLVLDDGPTQIVLQALIKNSSLKLLSLEGWTFRIEDEASIPMFLTFLESTSVRDLDLSSCRLHIAVHHSNLLHLSRQEDIVQEVLTCMPHLTCPSIVFLRLGTFQLSINEKIILRGPHLLPFLTGFTNLTDLDLSLDRTNLNSNTIPLVIDDKSLLSFFQLLSSSFRKLQTLKLANWRISLDDYEKTLKQIGRYLKIVGISYLKLNQIIVKDNSTKGTSLEHYFIQTVISSLSYLSWLSIMGVVLTPGQGAIIGKTIRDKFCGTLLEISVKNIPIESIKAIIHVLDVGGNHGNNKILVTFVGGPSCNLRIQRTLANSKTFHASHNVYVSAGGGKLKKFTSIS